jgi:hypothetical protein
MKVREGFVSNSSSSSFIVAAKGELTEALVLQALGVAETSPLYKFAKDIAGLLADAKEMDFEDLADWGDDGTLKNLIKRGFTVYEGSASDDDYRSAEAALCEMTINYESDDLVIIKEGGY